MHRKSIKFYPKFWYRKFPTAIVFCLVGFLFITNAEAQTKDYTRYVNPFIGTGGHGHTFPGATIPHGMVQLSPDTRVDNWDGSSGYHYSDNEIFGFSHTHLSGTGIPDYCDILLMPSPGKVDGFNNYKSTFSHSNEKAEAGYYSVKIDNGVTAELTATTRVGFHRYTFPKSDEAQILLDLFWRDKVLDSQAKVVGENKVEGFRRSSSWAKDQAVYFVIEFSKPFDKSVFSNGQILTKDSSSGKGVWASFKFKTEKNEQILVKVGISSVSIEGARKNLKAELPHWNFERVRADAKDAWNKELSRIEVSGGTDAQMTNFYTALYHTKIQPNVFQDVDGNYLGVDKKIHNIADDSNPKSKTQNLKSQNYTVFSLWDTFRAAHPLYTIIDEKRTADYINTFIRQYEQGGRLPVWELAGNETDTMIGYHSVSVIADAMTKGIKGFDYEKAFEAAKHSAELNHFGLEAYKKRGFISVEDENESVSKTLEYAFDDFSIAVMAGVLIRQKYDVAKKTGTLDRSKLADLDVFNRRARSFENLFDTETGFMRPKKNGGFVKPFAPQEVTFHFTEGNSWVYSFFVPHDINRLIKLMGGKRNFAKKLDELFTTNVKLSGREQPDITGLIGQYAHGNEPSHHIAYLYNYVGEPWKTQMYVRRILDEFYKPEPDGLIGNEDCGQMSAWYILSASGFYPVVPGTTFYDLGTPIFKEVKYHLENGKTFTVRAANVSAQNIYVKSVKLNGKPYQKTFIRHDDIKNGGVLEFEMSPAPVKTAFTEFSQSGIEQDFFAVPSIEGERVFKNQNQITLKSTVPQAQILYSTDGSEPRNLYSKPLTIDKTSVVKAVVTSMFGERSIIAEAKFFKRPNDWTIKIFSKYNRQYTGGGDEGLIDGIRGSLNFASGAWQGYQAQDFVAVVDLQRETEIHRLGGGFLQNARSWIWMPTRIEFEVSDDNVNFRKVAEIKTDVASDDMKEQIKDFSAEIAPVKARYVRVKAYNLGKIPTWHPGAGDDAFIFVDEIFIQ
jgi:predicted alpha-1,2-mannosidase